MCGAERAELVRKARQAIKDATSGYYDRWDRRYGHDEIPDYSLVQECFARIKEAGDVRSLMELGDLLKRRANEQEERSNDENGEIGSQVSACMDIVAEAVMSSDMDVLAKVKWEEGIRADDSFCVLDDMEVSYRTALKASEKDWGVIADYLARKASDAGDSVWESRAVRSRLCEALARAGRTEASVDCLKKATADDFGWRVADAVAKELPEESLKIWEEQIRANVASAHEACYQTICKVLGKMRPVMTRLGKGDAWKARVAELRAEYKRRRNFVAMLDALASGRGASDRIADW